MRKTYNLIFLSFVISVCTNVKIVNARNIRTVGDALQVIIPAYAFGLAMSEDGYEGAKQFGYSFVSSQATTEILKSLTQRKRPDYTLGKRKNSFPSGHTASAFLGATFIHRRYSLRQAIIPYVLSSFVGYSRIHANRHHPSDVLGGAILAGIHTWIFTHKYKNFSVTTDTKSTGIKYKTKL